MDALTAFGLFDATAMLVCYAMDARSHWWTLGFAPSCPLGSTCGFMHGAWSARGRHLSSRGGRSLVKAARLIHRPTPGEGIAIAPRQ